MTKRHKGDTKDFDEMTFAEQAKSINATIVNLQRAIAYHIRHSSNRERTKSKCLQQLRRMFQKLDI